MWRNWSEKESKKQRIRSENPDPTKSRTLFDGASCDRELNGKLTGSPNQLLSAEGDCLGSISNMVKTSDLAWLRCDCYPYPYCLLGFD